MKTKNAALIGAMTGAMLATPVLAAETCLQNNRIWSWQALDSRTLLITDRSYKRYTVHLSGGCVHLNTYTGATLLFQGKTSLGCVSQGDRIAFNAPGLGRLSCFVNGVDGPSAAAPAAGQ